MQFIKKTWGFTEEETEEDRLRFGNTGGKPADPLTNEEYTHAARAFIEHTLHAKAVRNSGSQDDRTQTVMLSGVDALTLRLAFQTAWGKQEESQAAGKFTPYTAIPFKLKKMNRWLDKWFRKNFYLDDEDEAPKAKLTSLKRYRFIENDYIPFICDGVHLKDHKGNFLYVPHAAYRITHAGVRFLTGGVSVPSRMLFFYRHKLDNDKFFWDTVAGLQEGADAQLVWENHVHQVYYSDVCRKNRTELLEEALNLVAKEELPDELR